MKCSRGCCFNEDAVVVIESALELMLLVFWYLLDDTSSYLCFWSDEVHLVDIQI